MINYLETAIEIALESGALLAQMFTTPLEISYKRPSDLVTEADRRSEALIVRGLHKHFPTHAVVSEEGGGQKIDSDYRWYVDPLDGTTNFAHGFPVFSMTPRARNCIARRRAGEPSAMGGACESRKLPPSPRVYWQPVFLLSTSGTI